MDHHGLGRVALERQPSEWQSFEYGHWRSCVCFLVGAASTPSGRPAVRAGRERINENKLSLIHLNPLTTRLRAEHDGAADRAAAADHHQHGQAGVVICIKAVCVRARLTQRPARIVHERLATGWRVTQQTGNKTKSSSGSADGVRFCNPVLRVACTRSAVDGATSRELTLDRQLEVWRVANGSEARQVASQTGVRGAKL